MTSGPHDNNPSPEVKPLPEGYLWRLVVVVFLLIGGGVCMLFFSGILGSLMSLAGLGFAKLSGLDEMVAPDKSKT